MRQNDTKATARAQRPGDAGERPGTQTSETVALALEVPLQTAGSKRAPLNSPVSGDVEGRGGVYVHTSLETSGPQVFEGSTVEYLDSERKRKRLKVLIAVTYALETAGREVESKALLSCGNYFRMGVLPCGTVKLIPFYCCSPFCPECSRRRAKVYQLKVWDIVRKDKNNLFHLTLTKKSVRTLDRSVIDDFIESLKRLRDSPEWREWIDGGFYSIEATYNEKNGWHPHAHLLIKAKGRLPDSFLPKIKAAWFAATGDSSYVHLERLYGMNKRGKKTRRVNERAIKEIVKYATKAADFCHSPELVVEFLDAFKNVRRLQSFGCFFRVDATVDKEVEPEKQSSALAGCSCGLCTFGQLHFEESLIHVSDTVLQNDGTRTLSPECKARWDCLRESVPEEEFVRSVARATVKVDAQLSLLDNAA